MTPHSSAGASIAHRTPGARDRRLSQPEPSYAASGERHDDCRRWEWSGHEVIVGIDRRALAGEWEKSRGDFRRL